MSLLQTADLIDRIRKIAGTWHATMCPPCRGYECELRSLDEYDRWEHPVFRTWFSDIERLIEERNGDIDAVDNLVKDMEELMFRYRASDMLDTLKQLQVVLKYFQGDTSHLLDFLKQYKYGPPRR